jgi:FKBP-type peptidyl-prolyl cis-trans isomerase (trigger factor)
VLGKIAEQEKMEATSEEVNAEIETVVNNTQENKEAVRQALNSEENRESIENSVVTRKVISYLTDLAKSPKDKKEDKAEA